MQGEPPAARTMIPPDAETELQEKEDDVRVWKSATVAEPQDKEAYELIEIPDDLTDDQKTAVKEL